MPRPRRVDDRPLPTSFRSLPDPGDFELESSNHQRRLALESRSLALFERWFDGIEKRIDLLEKGVAANPSDAKLAFAYERLISNVGATLKQLAPFRSTRAVRNQAPTVPQDEQESFNRVVEEVDRLSPTTRAALKQLFGQPEGPSEQIEAPQAVPVPE